VLATVTRSKGSTPQKPGSSALFGVNGLITGTVGGGIVEGQVHKKAMEAINSRTSGQFQYNLDNDISVENEAICGGTITVLIDAAIQNSIDVFKQLGTSVSEQVPGVLITMVTAHSGETVLVNRYWMSKDSKPVLPDPFIEVLEPAVERLLNGSDKSAYIETELSIPGEEPSSVFFLEPVFPPPQLVIAGAGHVGRALALIGRMVGFEVTVIDDRPEYANSVNIPHASHFIVKDIGEAMKELPKRPDTYVVIVTRSHKDDAAALRPCIASDLAYTGMIGSRNKIATIRTDFLKKGFATESQWNKIYTPVGLEIKSQSVEEIAVSIAAQLILVKNSRKQQQSNINKF
jgi:xanthine dehydrogenase accessory factor